MLTLLIAFFTLSLMPVITPLCFAASGRSAFAAFSSRQNQAVGMRSSGSFESLVRAVGELALDDKPLVFQLIHDSKTSRDDTDELRSLCEPLMPGERPDHISVDAWELGHAASLLALSETYNDYTPLLYALSIDAFNAFEILAACSGVDFEAQDPHGNNLLHLLVSCGLPNMMLDILAGHLRNARDLLPRLCEQPNNEGKTPLMLALEQRKYMLADSLLALYRRPPVLVGHASLTRLIDHDDRRIPFRVRLLATKDEYSSCSYLCREDIPSSHLLRQLRTFALHGSITSSALLRSLCQELRSTLTPEDFDREIIDYWYALLENAGLADCVIMFLDERWIDITNADRADEALLFAVQTNNTLLLRRLFAMGAKASSQAELFAAALKANASESIQVLFELKISLEGQERLDEPLLFGVVRNKYPLAVAKQLIEAGAAINARNEDAISVVEFAAQHRDWGLVKELCVREADVKTKSIYGTSPLAWAAFWNEFYWVEFFIDQGALADFVLPSYAFGLSPSYSKPGRIDQKIKKLLFAATPYVDGPEYRRTPLHEAAALGKQAPFFFHLKNKVNVNVQTAAGVTPLHEAAEHGWDVCVSYLLLYGADVHHKDKSGKTALYKAVENCHPKVIEHLLAYHASLTDAGCAPGTSLKDVPKKPAPTPAGWTKKQIAAHRKLCKDYTETIDLLTKHTPLVSLAPRSAGRLALAALDAHTPGADSAPERISRRSWCSCCEENT